MKTFSKVAVLFPLLAAACGGATHTDFRAAAADATPAEMECSESDPDGDVRLVFRVLKVGYREYHTP